MMLDGRENIAPEEILAISKYPKEQHAPTPVSDHIKFILV